VNRLLDKSERTRLGSKSGASELKQHKWFAKINWGLLRNTRPPVGFFFFFFPFFFFFFFFSFFFYYGMRGTLLVIIITVADMFLVDHSDIIQWLGRCELSTFEGVELATP